VDDGLSSASDPQNDHDTRYWEDTHEYGEIRIMKQASRIRPVGESLLFAMLPWV